MKISIVLATALLYASVTEAFKTKTPPLSTKWTKEAAEGKFDISKGRSTVVYTKIWV